MRTSPTGSPAAPRDAPYAASALALRRMRNAASESGLQSLASEYLRVAVVLIFGSSLAQASAAAHFTGLGDLPGGPFHSRPVGVSGDGRVVVGWSLSDDTSDGREAFRWTAAEGMVALGRLPGGTS